jgi:hypothetical protein
MTRYKVECVTIDYDSPYDDCRRIERIGFEAAAGGITTRTPTQVYEMVEEDGDTVLVEYRGEVSAVRGATRDGQDYVRTEPTDTADDVLMKKPNC